MTTSFETAEELMLVVPLIMRTIRAEMRARRGPDLSVPAFRALDYVRRNAGCSLSALADHMGLALPSASKLIDGLVERKLVVRRIHSGDRRRMTLDLTARGSALLESAFNSALVAIAGYLESVSEQERSEVIRAMAILNPIFARPTTRETTALGPTHIAHRHADRHLAAMGRR